MMAGIKFKSFSFFFFFLFFFFFFLWMCYQATQREREPAEEAQNTTCACVRALGGSKHEPQEDEMLLFVVLKNLMLNVQKDQKYR